MRCGRCGNENNDSNRFCGMCGAALVEKSPPADQPAASVASTRQVAASGQNAPVPSAPVPSFSRPTTAASVTTERRAGAVASPGSGPSSSSGIAGPSFLGLNTPPQTGTGARPGAYGAHDSLRPSSGSLDYLLEDEDEPRRGWGKLFFVVVALALAAGFGYLRFKQGGFDWLTNLTKKPAAAASPDNAPAAADSGKPGSPESVPTPTGSSNASPAPAPAANNGAAATPPDSTAPAVPSANGSDSTAAQNAAPAASQQSPQQPAQQSPQQAPQTTPGDSSASTEPAAQTDNSEDKAAAETTSPAPKARPSRAAPAPKSSAVRAGDSVGEAERYIYGRGVHQDCDHGLRILKPAAEQSNPKAMISLGALYSTGTCTPRDLPTAYRWFALALHKQPDNQVLQDDLQKLWSQMTPPERQLAIKLSQ